MKSVGNWPMKIFFTGFVTAGKDVKQAERVM
jgi:hypothetical protein